MTEEISKAENGARGILSSRVKIVTSGFRSKVSRKIYEGGSRIILDV